jgi:fucose 4-O-acetylase-like acetyltransferase
VAGHFDPATSPPYWLQARNIIYSFHMPLFFILSGYLFNHGKYSYGDLIKNKAKRLLYPFVSIAFVFLLIKYAAGRIVRLEYAVDARSMSALLANPVNSYVPLLWFVHALFIIFAIYPLARLILNNLSILALTLALNLFLGSNFPVVGNALANLPFFAIGVLLKENKEPAAKVMSGDWRNVFAPLAIFLSTYLVLTLTHNTSQYEYAAEFFLGVMGSLLIINVSNAIVAFSENKLSRVLRQIGYYSMTIYLFHTLFESAVRMGLPKLFTNTQAPFVLVAATAITCGVVFPLLLEKRILRRFWLTKTFVLGLN